MVNLFQLQLFVAAHDRGSFSAAADHYSLTQPAVSQHIRSLEDAYKVKLFTRNGPHIELTVAGQRLLEIARPLVQQAEHLEETFKADLGEVYGKVKIIYGKNTASALYLLPRLIAEFHQLYGGVRFLLTGEREETALDMLLSREGHFALLSSPPRQKSLESHLLYTDELVLALPPGHPWQGQQIEVKRLKDQPFLLRAAGSETRRVIEAALRSVSLSLLDLQVVAELDSVEGVVLAAEAGLGVGLASTFVVQRFVEAGRLGQAFLRPTERRTAPSVDFKREMHLVRLLAPGLERTPGPERFWEFVQNNRVLLPLPHPIQAAED